MVSMGEWRLAVGEAAIRLSGRTEGVLWPKLEASVDGFQIEVWRTLGGDNSPSTTEFQVWLPGWPTSSSLTLVPARRRIRHWPIIRDRYLWFDDADWDNSFAVRAKDPDMVRLHLNTKRRAAIKTWFDAKDTTVRKGLAIKKSEGRTWFSQTPRGVHTTGIKAGRVRSSPRDMITGPQDIVSRVQRMVELAKIITE